MITESARQGALQYNSKNGLNLNTDTKTILIIIVLTLTVSSIVAANYYVNFKSSPCFDKFKSSKEIVITDADNFNTPLNSNVKSKLIKDPTVQSEKQYERLIVTTTADEEEEEGVLS